MKRIDWGRTLVVVGVFALVGPFIGFLAALGWSISQVPEDAPRLRSLMLLSGFFTIVVGYVIGLPLAVLTGLASGLASHWMRSSLIWVLATTAMGAAQTYALHPVVSPNTGQGLVVSSAAVASLACALTLASVRPRFRPAKAAAI